MALYLGNSLVGNIYVGTTIGGITNITLNNPTITVSNTGLITAQVIQSTGGMISANSTATSTQQLSTVNSTTITPTSTSQTAVAANKYTLGAITIAAVPTETKNITSNGTYTPSTGKWFSSVTVNIPTGSTINNQNKTVTPTTSLQSITADSGYTGLGTVTINAIATETKTATPSTSTQNITPSSGKYLTKVTVNPIPSNYIIPSGNKSITNNGTNIDVTQYATVSVNVPTGGGGVTINNQNKTITPSESQQSITADSGYTGLGTVTINAISSTYIGSDISQNDSNNLTVSGATVTAPAGYYASAASKTVASMTLPTSAASSSSGTAKATINRSTNNQYINIPVGYNATASYYTISAVANGSVTSPSAISGTSATLTTGTNTITLTKSISVTPNVTTAGYISAGTAGNASVSLTASVTTKAAATYRASTSNQTIDAGTYLTGAQTIAAVSQTNLSAANIKAGTTISISNGSSNIWSITGTFTSDANAIAADLNSGKTAYVNGVKITGEQVINKFYTGSSTPSSSLGNNGDIYLQE